MKFCLQIKLSLFDFSSSQDFWDLTKLLNDSSLVDYIEDSEFAKVIYFIKENLRFTDDTNNPFNKLKIKIIDSYLAYAIKESNHPALSNGTVVYLINNESKDCYFFRYSDSKNELSQNPIAKGTYDFSVKLENGFGNSSPTYAIPYLTLNYASDEQGNFTDASTPPTPHKLRFELFDGVTSVNAVINLIQRYLKIDWEQLINKALTRSDYLIIPTLKTTIDNTDYTIIGTLDTHPEIPENILE